jgi:ribonuclease D
MTTNNVDQKDFRWIDSESELHQLVTELTAIQAAGNLTRSYVDTEADSLHHYQEKLCLIQLAAGGIHALIDPLNIKDMTPLLRLLDETELWLHGADYDLSLLKRTYGWTPRCIRDTQIASRLTGHRAFGLAALVEKHCGVALCKSSQKEDWSQRPLPDKMQTYAVDDVRYLPRLVDILIRELEDKKRFPWFEQSCAALSNDVLARKEKDRDEAWRINGSGRLRPMGMALLRSLWYWRDSMARERDVPAFKVLNNQQMLDMAADFERTGDVATPHRWRGKWKETFESILAEIKQSSPESWPQKIRKNERRMSEAEKDYANRLCALKDRKAEALDLDSSLLGSRALMEDLAQQQGVDQKGRLMPWQSEVMKDILNQPSQLLL